MKANNTHAYFDKFNCGISRERWNELRSDPAYYVCREYENEAVHLKVIWNGKVSKSEYENLLSSYYPIFKLTVLNSVGCGKWVDDPVESGVTFPTLELANHHVNDFLAKNTNSHWSEKGFVEPDNKLIPPPPPDPDLPVSTGLTDDFGAW